MGEVARPHGPVYTDLVADLHAEGIVDEPPIDEVAQVLAREAVEPGQAHIVVGPTDGALIEHVGLFEEDRQPTDVRLGKVDAEVGKPVEGARERELEGVEPAAAVEGGNVAERVAGLRMDVGRRCLRIGIGGSRASGAVAELDVDRHRDPEVHGFAPEDVVLLRRVAPAARPPVQADALEPSLSAVAQLGEGLVDPGLGNEPESQQPLRVDGGVLLDEVLVVGVDDGQVGVVKGNPAPEVGPADTREQHLGVDPVASHLRQALFTGPCSGGPLVAQSGGLELLERAARQFQPDGPQRASLDQPGITADGQPDSSRRSLPMLVGHPAHPAVDGDLQVRVSADDLVVHGSFLASCSTVEELAVQ